MKKVIFLLLAISIVSCKDSEKKEVQKPEVKLYVLDGGSILVKKLEAFSQDTTYTGQSKTVFRCVLCNLTSKRKLNVGCWFARTISCSRAL